MQQISDNSFNELIRVLETFMVISFKLKVALKKVLFEVTYEKDSRILNFGERQENVWFLLDGLLREIRMNKLTLKESTTWFWLPHHFVYTDPGFFSQQFSERAIVVMECCTAVFISYSQWLALKEVFKEVEVVTERIRAEHYNLRMEHAWEMKILSTHELYLDKEQVLNYLFPRTQLSYIADFMGMAADTLGRLRTKQLGKRRC